MLLGNVNTFLSEFFLLFLWEILPLSKGHMAVWKKISLWWKQSLSNNLEAQVSKLQFQGQSGLDRVSSGLVWLFSKILSQKKKAKMRENDVEDSFTCTVNWDPHSFKRYISDISLIKILHVIMIFLYIFIVCIMHTITPKIRTLNHHKWW